MLCPRCGGINDETLQFCRTCGMNLQAQSMQPATVGSQSSHLEATAPVLGILWLALAALSTFGLVRIYLLYHHQGVDLLGPGFLITAIQSILGILLKCLVAYALLAYRSWARVLAIIVTIYHLLMIAVGQASLLLYDLHTHRFAVYAPFAILSLLAAILIYVSTLVVFAPAKTGMAWQAIVERKNKNAVRPQQ